MPIRKSDLGHIYAQITVRPLAGAAKSWTGAALVDTGAADTFLPTRVLRKLCIRSAGRRSYELADGAELDLPIGFGVIEILGEAAGGTLVFADENEEPLLGVTVLELASPADLCGNKNLISHRSRRISERLLDILCTQMRMFSHDIIAAGPGCHPFKDDLD